MVLQMLIGEALNAEALTVVQAVFEDLWPGLLQEPGIYTAELVTEHGGSMLILLIFWHSREDACSFQGTKRRREITGLLCRYLVGDPVVKLFKVAERPKEKAAF